MGANRKGCRTDYMKPFPTLSCVGEKNNKIKKKILRGVATTPLGERRINEWIDFSIEKNRVNELNLAKVWSKNRANWYWMGHFFVEKNMDGNCSTLKYPAAHPYQNQTWVSPPRLFNVNQQVLPTQVTTEE